MECDYGAECRAVSNESIDAPDFVRLDLRKKQFSGITAGEATEPDAIDSVEDLDNHLIVQGVQGSRATNPLGWSLSINQTTGRLTLTASGDDGRVRRVRGVHYVVVRIEGHKDQTLTRLISI